MTPEDEPELPRTEPEGHAERLGFALRSLSAELVEERQKVAELRREVAGLRARLESRHQATKRSDQPEVGAPTARLGPRDAELPDARRSGPVTPSMASLGARGSGSNGARS